MKPLCSSTWLLGIWEGSRIEHGDAVVHCLNSNTPKTLIVTRHHKNPSSFENGPNVVIKRNPFNIVGGRGNPEFAIIRHDT